MSRLIVKNLPKVFTEDKLRELFNSNGTITDIQLKYTKEGTFRRFGFIGFQVEEEADRAIQSLHDTFINTSKISVQKCALLGDANKPKAWSKYAPDSTAFKKANKAKKKIDIDKPSKKEKKEKKKDEVVELLEKYKDDPMFEEFLQVHGKADKLEKFKAKVLKSLSAIDDQDKAPHSVDVNESGLAEENDEKLSEKPISDLEYMKKLMQNSDPNVERKPRQKMEKKPKEKVQLFNLKLNNLPYNVKKRDIKEFFRPNVPFSIRIPRNIHGIAFVGYKTEKGFKVALSKNKSFIKGKQILVTHYEVKHSDASTEQTDPKKSKWKSQEDALKNEEDIAESGRIFLRNLAYTTNETDVEELFSKYGPIAEVTLPIDSATRKPKGFGIVTFMMPEHAVRAYSELDGSILHGRMIHLLPGKAKESQDDNNLEETSNFKQKKTAKQKSQAGSSHNWNALFLGPNAVAETIADVYDVAKESVVGPEAKGSAAVRLAIGETQIVMQTKKYLEQNGVVVDVFNTAPKIRSKTVILAKNLPAKTEAREIRDIFKKHGELGRVILPPSGITAIVEFVEPSEARKAFRKLSYSKFKNSPLYLEWAPENSLSEDKSAIERSAVQKEQEQEVIDEENTVVSNEANNQETCETQVESEEEEEPEPDTTLFVKNLNFQTTDEGLKKHFQGCGKMKYATVATKKNKTTPGGKLSMGYGFVQFYLKKSADKALKTLQQSVLDGKSLELKRSERTLKNETTTSARKTSKLTKQTGSKILVRNVPFEAKKTEIFQLFTPFGEIKAVRLPKKMSSGADSHRGYAFVEYVSATDAKAAFDAIGVSTHLLGRRLVLEWATTEEKVDDIRKRTAEHFGTKEVVKSKKSVFNLD